MRNVVNTSGRQSDVTGVCLSSSFMSEESADDENGEKIIKRHPQWRSAGLLVLNLDYV